MDGDGVECRSVDESEDGREEVVEAGEGWVAPRKRHSS